MQGKMSLELDGVCVCVKNGTLTQTLYGFRLTVESMREAWQTRCVHGLERTASLR